MKKLTLATEYTPEALARSPSWWWSEKLDGWRAYWDGTTLYTRSGRALHPPKQWVAGLPRAALDGELYVRRGAYAMLSGILQSSTENRWHPVRFCVFDMPRVRCGYPARYAKLVKLVDRMHQTKPATPLRLIEQKPVRAKTPERIAADVIEGGGEGIMLRDVDDAKRMYVSGRYLGLLKLKQRADAEATVVQVDRVRLRLRALVVRNDKGIVFRLGTGFTHDQRHDPTFGRVGDTVTYKFNGTTANGVPRHAVYLRHLRNFF